MLLASVKLVVFINIGTVVLFQTLDCKSCGMACRKSSAIDKAFCEIVVSDKVKEKHRLFVNQDCLTEMLGSDYKLLKEEVDTKMVAFEKTMDFDYMVYFLKNYCESYIYSSILLYMIWHMSGSLFHQYHT